MLFYYFDQREWTHHILRKCCDSYSTIPIVGVMKEIYSGIKSSRKSSELKISTSITIEMCVNVINVRISSWNDDYLINLHLMIRLWSSNLLRPRVFDLIDVDSRECLHIVNHHTVSRWRDAHGRLCAVGSMYLWGRAENLRASSLKIPTCSVV